MTFSLFSTRISKLGRSTDLNCGRRGLKLNKLGRVVQTTEKVHARHQIGSSLQAAKIQRLGQYGRMSMRE